MRQQTHRCRYIHLYIYIYIFTYESKDSYNIQIATDISTYITRYAFARTCIFAHTYISVCVCVCACVYVFTYVFYMYISVHLHFYTDIYIYIYILKHMCLPRLDARYKYTISTGDWVNLTAGEGPGVPTGDGPTYRAPLLQPMWLFPQIRRAFGVRWGRSAAVISEAPTSRK